jgi:hypothetical protein
VIGIWGRPILSLGGELSLLGASSYEFSDDAELDRDWRYASKIAMSSVESLPRRSSKC